jgi:hypothetical protein
MLKSKSRVVECMAVFALLISCSSPTIKDINDRAVAIAKEAQSLKAEGKIEEAVRLIQSLEELHPNDPIITEILKSATAEQLESVTPSKLAGYNRGLRPKVVATTGEKIAWYIPDRIMDFIEQIDLWISVGPQIGFGGHVTRALQVEAFTGGSIGVGIGQKKMIGFRSDATTEIGLGPVVLAAVAGGKAGSGGLSYTADAIWFHTPSKPIYQNYRDYWGIGGHGAFVFGIELEYHPLEIVDFLGGIFLYDPMNDDYATTRRLKYTSRQSSLVRSFSADVNGLEEADVNMYKKDFPTLILDTGATTVPPAQTPQKKK